MGDVAVKKVGITGANGLIGQHLRCHLKALTKAVVMEASRSTFLDPKDLEAFCKEADVIVHLAGMNRGPDDIVAATNIGLTSSLLDACKRTKSQPHIIFSSSTHVERPTEYGKAKRICGELLENWAHETGGKATILVIPGVFGEGGKPFYNSVVSTFCSQLATMAKPSIDINARLELIHAQALSAQIWNIIEADGRSSGPQETRIPGQEILVSDLLTKLTEFNSLYVEQNLIPDLSDKFELALFNTFRSYLFPNFYPRDLVLRSDARGHLFEAVKSNAGGQTFVSLTKPGVTRGNHFHLSKIERFCVLKGEAVIKIRRLFSDVVREFKVSGSKPQIIDIPTLHTHSISNVGEGELFTLFWTNEIFDPDNPDTYVEIV